MHFFVGDYGMITLINILRLVIFFIIVKLIWGIISALFLSGNSHQIKGRPYRRASAWDYIDKQKVEDADYTEID